MQNESIRGVSGNPESKSFFDKIKEHKKEIIVAGITVAAVVGVILTTENWDFDKKVCFSRGFEKRHR